MGRTRRTPAPPAQAAVTLPHGYTPRPYQQPFWDAMRRGTRYAALVWHRRAGKDTSAFNWLLYAAVQRVGTYYYVFPTFAQGKRVIWDGLIEDAAGVAQRFLDFIPAPLLASKNETDLKVVLTTGSTIQLIGSDRYDDLRGPNPVGVVFSEYAKQHPAAWKVVAPIIRQNKGWAVFVYTPLGKNHGWELYEMARQNPEWYAELLTVEQTGVMTPEDLAAERAAGMDEEAIQQEYYCSFRGAVQGSYYARELARAQADGRIGRVPYDPRLPVETAWDIGHQDATAIWFYQQVGRRVQLIDYLEASGSNLITLAAEIHEKGYAYRAGQPHIAPHDVRRTDWGTGKTPFEIARDLARPLHFRVIPKMNPLERITAARVLFPRCYFNEVTCAAGLAALYQYHKDWDPVTKAFTIKPAHDWSSHGADAFGHLAIGLEAPDERPPQTQAVTGFDPFTYDADAELARAGIRVERDFEPFAA